MSTKRRQKPNENKPSSDYSDVDEDEDRNKERYNESFALIGTPLPEIPPPGATGVKDDGKFVPVWKQEVKRFHGAFTGGFSAGYYNTVGSKEGWAPSTFVSSRVSRSTHNASRAEDFMDEEDLAEYTGAQNLVPTEEFDSLGFTARDIEMKRTVAGTMDNSTLGVLSDKLIDDLVVPTNEPIGIRLLKKMGWREGQGIGPRAFRARKRRKFTQSATDPDPEDEDNTAIDPYARGILFAPKDTNVVSYAQKADTRGLGYDPYKNANEFRATNLEDEDIPASLYTSARNARTTKNSGFGTGALDDDDDDEDVYGSSSFSRSKYTSSLVEEEDEESFVVGMQRFSKAGKSATPVVKSLKITGRKVCNDGKEPMRAFVLAVKATGLGKWFRPPVPPSGYRPIVRFAAPGPASLPVEKQYNRSSHQNSSALAAKADERATILGEEPIDAPRRSVFDYISNRDKTRLQSLAGIYGANAVETAEAKKVAPTVPHVDRQKAVAALRGFAPFQNDASKQERYRRFLQVKAGTLEEDPTKTRSEEELILGKDFDGKLDEIPDSTRREWSEFASAAEIFRPMSSLMASRFTTAGSTAAAKEFAQPEGGLRAGAEARPDQDGAVANMIEKLIQEKEQKTAKAMDARKDFGENDEKSMQTKAASMSMYGPLTRTISTFHPTRLVCKRFNVPVPHPEPEPSASGDGTRRRADGRAVKGGLTRELVQQMLETSRRDKEVEAGTRSPKTEEASTVRTAVDERTEGNRLVELKENHAMEARVDSLPREVSDLERTRPGMDIFRAIFQDSEDEDNEEEQDEDVEEKPKQEPHSTLEAPGKTRAPAIPFRPMFVPKSKRGAEVEPRKEPEQKPATTISEPNVTVKAPTASMTLAAALDAVRKKEREQEERSLRKRSKSPPSRKPRRSEKATYISSDEEEEEVRGEGRKSRTKKKSGRRDGRDETETDRYRVENKEHSKRHERRERTDRSSKHHREDDRKRKREEKQRRKIEREDRSPRREQRDRHDRHEEKYRKRKHESDSSQEDDDVEIEKRRRKQRSSPPQQQIHENSQKNVSESSEGETELYGPPRPPPPPSSPKIVPDVTVPSEDFHPIPKRRARAADLW